MKKIISPIFLILLISSFVSCKKWDGEHRNIYSYVAPPASPISDAAPLCGSIKGTMLSGKTYTIGCDVTIPQGDTLLIQSGVTVNVTNTAAIIVSGTFISTGTKANPNYITVKGIVKNDAPGVQPSKDPAYSALWKGILANTTCPLMVIKWTHIEFAGAAYGASGTPVGQSATTSYNMLFQNFNGVFVLEDSWLYGGTDDCIRISDGKISVMRNTFEKTGLSGGDCVNVKGGTVGTMGYNLFVGTATNGQKVSNKGQATGAPETNIVMYNSTFVNGGYRQISIGRGANIDYEQGAEGMYYNNVQINCKFGYRVVGNPAADTAHLFYGNNYQWADSVSVANQFYPVGYISKPKATDIPTYTTFLPSNYTLGAAYNGTAAVQQMNPQFINYPLPVTGGLSLNAIQAVGNYNFRLSAGSPLIGKGYTKFSPLIVVPIDPVYGATEITLPGADLGCYQSNGSGNQH